MYCNVAHVVSFDREVPMRQISCYVLPCFLVNKKLGIVSWLVVSVNNKDNAIREYSSSTLVLAVSKSCRPYGIDLQVLLVFRPLFAAHLAHMGPKTEALNTPLIGWLSLRISHSARQASSIRGA